MFLLLLLAAGLGYAYYRGPGATGGERAPAALPPKEVPLVKDTDLDTTPPLDMSLDARFDRALTDLRKDPITRATFRAFITMMGSADPTEADVEAALVEGEKKQRQHWSDKEPHGLAEDALTNRETGAQLLYVVSVKDKSNPMLPMMLEIAKAGDPVAFELKTRRLSDLQQEKIQLLTKQGKNLDEAFDIIDAGGEPSKAAMVNVNLIDRAALSPLIFQYAGADFDPYTKQAEGVFVDATTNMVAGSGKVELGRAVGQVDSGPSTQMVHIAEVVAFTPDADAPAVPAGSYFAPGTNIYASRPLETV